MNGQYPRFKNFLLLRGARRKFFYSRPPSWSLSETAGTSDGAPVGESQARYNAASARRANGVGNRALAEPVAAKAAGGSPKERNSLLLNLQSV